MWIKANEIKKGMRVRPKGARAGRHWLSVQTVKRQGFLVRIEGEWVAGGTHEWRVKRTAQFSGGFPPCSAS